MILVTSASWENVGTNPYENVAKAKNIGTLIVIVLVFDRSQSLVAPVILGFASERKVPSKVVGRPSIEQRKYAFEIEAKRENLRRLYRHFLLFAEQMPYRSLQVSNRHCSACSMRDACTCDVHLYNTYHCDADTYEPLITVGCPSDITSDTESGLSTATIIWLSAQAIDYSTYMSKHVILETNGFTNVTNNVRDVNSTHKSNTFPIGVSKVTQRFVDGSGNAVNCSFKVTVVDNEVPKIFNCPSATIYDNTTSLMATKRIYWPEVTSTDNSGVKPTSKLYINNILKANGDQYFGIGYSTVRIEFIDQSKNFASCRFDVVVKDYSPPTVQQCYGTNNSVILSDDTQAYVDWVEPMFIDNSGLSVNISSDKQPGYFRKGSHTVTYTATDAFGNSNSCSFNFTVKGYPCKAIRAPLNGALVCDNIADGASCQIFCQNPYEFESLSDVIALPETYLCKGKGTWYPTNKVPNCVEHQGIFKRLPKTYYYDGDCKDPAVSEDLRKNAAKHYRGFVEGQYFKEAYFREANATDFRMPECGGGPLQPTRKVVIIPPTGPGGPVSKPRPTPSTINPKTNGANAVAG
ncbi:uncharacterized protein [Watersipora subatra]|uniref:uncharacterized protein n=1 Tax=Watersipora subatra TaxID=2589382 RepID=UPI00355C35E8